MKLIKKLVKVAVNAVKPYRVCIAWGFDAFEHRAMTFADAQSWARQYPGSADVWIKTRRGRVVSFRSQRVAAFGCSAYRA
jgi:hypothetical protein